eukprot:TRINITY_DN25957_c0_g2_i1.p1 TRINITY_DN25957_c0_g2~~TRINITY_DN25957_c0_g2_i1.p1  ORF type:complete len:433 (-),score=89.21 TRINITY_DN25957_c0_g2_i1:251-1492(-)
MGVDFRGKGYVRRVRFGKRTIKEGEAVAVWDSYGTHRQVNGPALLRLWWSTIRFLDRHVAGKDEYLRILHMDGTVEHTKGPATLFENPVYHRKVTVEQAIKLKDASQHVVVYREKGTQSGAASSSSAPERSSPSAFEAAQLILSGPLVFIPLPTDSVHVFTWGDCAKDVGPKRHCGFVQQGAHVLDTEYKLTRSVRCDIKGADGYGATATVLVQICLAGVKEVLVVADPLAECDAHVRAALADAAANLRFHDASKPLAPTLRAVVSNRVFVERLQAALANNAACRMLSVSLGDMTPAPDLVQVMSHEDELAAQRVVEKKADAALEAAQARQEREHALESAKQRHALELQAEREAAESRRAKAEAAQAIAFLKELKAVGADVTKYLEAQATRPKAPAGVFQGSEGAKAAGLGWW